MADAKIPKLILSKNIWPKHKMLEELRTFCH